LSILFHLSQLALDFLKSLIAMRRTIWELSVQDFKQRFAGNYLGIFWAFTNPLINILIMWFVFQVGFKAQPVENVPFILWLVSGMIPWFFFADALGQGTASILEKPYLVKKVVFRVATLPVIKIINSLFLHTFFVIFLYFSFLLYYRQSFYLTYFQIPYYFLCNSIFLLGLSWITSSIIIFIKDIGNVVGIAIQFGFWLTPVFWSYKTVPDAYRFYLKLNPVFYIIEGYRDCFIYNVWFWDKPILTLYFWSITFLLLIIGAIVFRKLRPHFADVL
jgi:lipopolysaccharide transport system permease protein/teichoic acid transport system permease protein